MQDWNNNRVVDRPPQEATLTEPEPLPFHLAGDPAAVAVADYRQPVAYVSGPYRDPRGTYYVEQNIRAAERVAVELWRLGYAVICPHANTRHFDGCCPSSDDVFIRGDLELVRRSDVVVTLPNWARSAGARNEVAAAHYSNVLVLNWMDAAMPYLELIGREGRAAIPEARRQLAELN